MSEPKRQRMNPDDRRAQLLKAAFKVFADQGLERAGHGDIAKQTGVSTATVFNYFPTRQDLTQAVLDDIRGQIDNVFRIIESNNISVKGNVPMLAAAFDFVIANEPEMVRVFLRWAVATTPDMREPFLELQSELLAQISHHMGTSEDSSHTDARIILGSAIMFALMRLDNAPEEDAQKCVDRLNEFLN